LLLHQAKNVKCPTPIRLIKESSFSSCYTICKEMMISEMFLHSPPAQQRPAMPICDPTRPRRHGRMRSPTRGMPPLLGQTPYPSRRRWAAWRLPSRLLLWVPARMHQGWAEAVSEATVGWDLDNEHVPRSGLPSCLYAARSTKIELERHEIRLQR
jgi:hypothetical protein